MRNALLGALLAVKTRFAVRLALLATAVVILPLVAIAVLSSCLVTHAFEVQATRVVAALGQDAAGEVRQFLLEREGDARALAGNPALADPAGDPDAKRAFLAHVAAVYQGYEWIGYADAAGTIVASTGGMSEGKDVSRELWFKRGLGGLYFEDLHSDDLVDGRNVLTYSSPVRDSAGRVTGVVSTRVGTAKLRSILRDLHVGLTDHVYLALADGKTLASALRGSGSGQALEVVVPLKEAGTLAAVPAWHVVSRMDRAEALAPARQLVAWILLIAGVAALLTSLAAWAFGRQVLAPVLAMGTASDRLAHGERSIQILVTGHDEFARTSQAFNQMSRQIADTIHELDQANRSLTDANRRQRDMVSTVSHELRVPLTSIVGYAEFLEDEVAGEPSAKMSGYVQRIQENTRLLNRLANDLLDSSRLDHGDLHMHVRTGDLGVELSRAIRSIRPIARDKGLALEFVEPAEPLESRFDPERVAQVCLNLLGNAIKFTPAGGTIRVRVADGDGEYRIEVEDSGVGIPEDKQARLFERFYQVHRGSGPLRGVGLGLAISRAIVEAHGGRIGVESAEGRGSTFWFTLPRT